MSRWSPASTTPPLDDKNRCENLWLYNAAGVDVVIRGSFTHYGDDYTGAKLEGQGSDDGDFLDGSGVFVMPTHYTLVLPGETTPPPPPGAED